MNILMQPLWAILSMIRAEQVCFHVKQKDKASANSQTDTLATPNDHALVILDNINLDIQSGTSVAIVGASGSGKSSLLGLLAGLDVPTAGKIFIDNIDITQQSEEQRAQMRSKYVAFVFQNFQLLPSLTAAENIALPLEIKNDSKARAKSVQYLSDFGLANRANHLPSQLSGGEQQRVALARAFACNAPIIFADEPTGNLDSATGEKITSLLFDMNKHNKTTLILVTHSNELANRCDRQLEMKAGRLSEPQKNY